VGLNQGITAFDEVQHFWCPMLGQTIRFGYCRKYQQGLPCSRVLTCYESHFDVLSFVMNHYSESQRAGFLEGAKGRMDLVAEALAGAPKAKG
jgi:hypothetical protein